MIFSAWKELHCHFERDYAVSPDFVLLDGHIHNINQNSTWSGEHLIFSAAIINIFIILSNCTILSFCWLDVIRGFFVIVNVLFPDFFLDMFVIFILEGYLFFCFHLNGANLLYMFVKFRNFVMDSLGFLCM